MCVWIHIVEITHTHTHGTSSVCMYMSVYTYRAHEIVSLRGPSHLPEEVHDVAEVPWNEQDQSHCRGEHQSRSRCEATGVNHGQKPGLGNKARCQARPRGAAVDVYLGKLPVLFPAKLTVDTSVPNLTVLVPRAPRCGSVAHLG